MFGRFVNLPFKVLNTVARAVQERDAAQWQKKGEAPQQEAQDPARDPMWVPEDFDPGPIRIRGKKALAEHKVILDVGSAQEWHTGHPAGAMHIPAKELDIRLAELPPAVRIIVIARTSGESERIVRFLRHRGLDDTWSLHGGLSAWSRAGGAVQKG